MAAVLSGKAGGWLVSIPVEMDQPERARFPRACAGVEVGLQRLAVLSDGTPSENQALLRSELTHLKRVNRRQMGSQRWQGANDPFARFHGRSADRRADTIHKMTTRVASPYAVLGIEDLNAAGMLSNHCITLSHSDASFGERRRQWTYQSDWFGGWVIPIGRFYPSSQECSLCGVKNRALTLEDREWTCQKCVTQHDRDDNAALNIPAEAIRLLNHTTRVARSGSRLVDRVYDQLCGNPG